MPTLRQNSFAGGEISPSLFGRVDQQKYATGLAKCQNMIVKRQGAVENRTGTFHHGLARQSNNNVRVLEFIVSTDVSYVIEIGDGGYFRIWQGGQHLPQPDTFDLDDVNQGTLTWTVGLTYDEGFAVVYNGVWYVCIDSDGSGVTPPDINTDSWYPNTTGIFEYPSPFTGDQVFEMHRAQSADVMTMTHEEVRTQDLIRYVAYALNSSGEQEYYQNTFKMENKNFAPIANPQNITASAGGTGNTYAYAVTAEGPDGQESVQGGSDEPPLNISGVTTGLVSTTITTSVNHDLVSGDPVIIVGNSTPDLDGVYFVTVVNATQFEIEFNSSGLTPATDGVVGKLFYRIVNVAEPAPSTPITVTWDRVNGAFRYAVYRQTNGVFGFIGYAKGETYDDTGGDPDLTSTPPQFNREFREPGDYPATVCYYQQRLALANSINNPERIDMSETGRYNYFQKKVPLPADGTVQIQLSGLRVNDVRAMVGLDNLAIFTETGEWFIAGDQDGSITPATINARQAGYNGSSRLQPAIVNNHAIYVQSRQTIIRSLAFNISSGGYQTTELSIFADHLFQDRTIVDWAWQQVPDSVLWCVLDNGTIAALTYIPEHEIWAWHTHQTDGLFKSVAVVPENDQDVTYFVVDRQVQGGSTRHIERLTRRDLSDPEAYCFLDGAGYFDGNNTDQSAYLAANRGPMGQNTWDYDDDLVVTRLGGSAFTAALVGNSWIIRNGDDSIIVDIIGITDPSTASVRARKTVPVDLRGFNSFDWCLMTDEITGLGYLEGKQVNVFGDGNVYGPFTVSAGTITLPQTVCKGYVGCGYLSQIETLNVEIITAETQIDKLKRPNRISMLVENTRGFWAGQKGAKDLWEYKQRRPEDNYDPIALKNGKAEIQISGRWDDDGRLVIEQRDPLPLTILSLAGNIQIGD